MSGEVYDVIVVGAGIEGSASAYYLAKRGKRTLLLEQFPLPHSRGSSHGQSRITRKAYPEDFYTEMMHEATDVWKELEKEAGWEIFRQTGFLAIGQYKGLFLEDNANSLRQNKVDFEYLNPADFQRRFPMLSFPADFGGIVDDCGGILRSEKALRAYQTLFVKYGGCLVDSAMATNIKRGSVVTVETPNTTYRGRSVIICPGPWADKILRSLGVRIPFETTRITVCYWREKNPGSYDVSLFRPFSERGITNAGSYGVPSFEYPGHVKVTASNCPQ